MPVLEENPAIVSKAINPAASRLLAKLKDLAKSGGENAFERASLAEKLMRDKVWIAEQHDGDSGKALDWLEADYFGDMALPLPKILKLVEAFPDVKQWAECKFRLAVLWAKWEEANPKKRNGEKDERAPANSKLLKEQEDQIAHLEAVAKTKDRAMMQLESEAEALRRQVRQLEEQNAELRGRIQELEKLVRR